MEDQTYLFTSYIMLRGAPLEHSPEAEAEARPCGVGPYRPEEAPVTKPELPRHDVSW